MMMSLAMVIGVVSMTAAQPEGSSSGGGAGAGQGAVLGASAGATTGVSSGAVGGAIGGAIAGPIVSESGADASASPAGSAATAQPSVPPRGRGDEWVIRVQPRVWFVAPEGDVRLPGSSREVDVGRLDLDELRVAPYGQLDVQVDRLLFSFSGMSTKNSSDLTAGRAFTLGGVDVSAGEDFDARLRFSTFNITGGYKVWQHNFTDDARSDALPARNVLRVWGVGGVRVNDLDFRLQTADQRQQADDTWIDVVGGIKTEFQFLDAFSADAEATIGGLDGSFSLDVAFSLSYRPVDWVAAQVGYRILFISREDGSGSGQFDYDGSFAGLYAGVTFRF